MSMEFLVRVERSNGSRPAGCGSALDQLYWQLCDIWGIVVQAAAALGFVSCIALASLLLLWLVCASCRCGRPVSTTAVAALLLFLLGTAGMFALPFSFVISLSPQTCPVRVFLFGMLFCIVFGALLARGLVLMDVGLVRGWREAGVTVTLVLVQVIISVEWLLVVLIRDERTCEFSQAEFVMLQIYVMVLLAAALVTALRFLCNAYITYSYSYTGRQMHRHTKLQAALLVLTLLLSVCVWIVWITLLIYGNRAMGHSPDWDDPVISIALTANGWVLLLGHGFSQVHFMCQCEARMKDPPLHFTGWTSPGKTPAAVTEETKTGRDNSGFQMDTDERRGKDVESPGIIMTEISTEKDYSIPRPTTTNINKPYDEYYIHRV
ncbi:G-protein coupled receptor family C group 5 member B-like [Myxocyprinus asiaticus]|uniref:G-protein coupled receptor family C group 5 member B-like n=1 Tax=Myxocyprinus asiaticus TaxID=70543 RepID=UPI0022213D43|nr:G-protein coupled receptor family C group 5 member B-like [Myxocyprinus asiaticus]XP_051569749.1 G-protein coupled receptor family C group 5 member B-like [Myxocyprinus asiaticus]